ncbi:MAG: OmpW/AlkL family protein [Thiomonas sp.]
MTMTHLHRTVLASALALGSLALLPAAHADDFPKNIIYLGAAYLNNHSSLPNLSGYNTPPNLNLAVGNATTLGLGYVRNLPGPWSFELALGYPPRVRTYAEGSGWGSLARAGVTDVDVYSPTAFINYHIRGKEATWDPFVGLGLNYTWFRNNTALQPLKDDLRTNQVDIHLSSNWALAAHVGMIYRLNSRWSVVGTIAYADVRSDLTTTSYQNAQPESSVRVITSQAKTTIKFNPVIYTLAVGYSF